MKIPDRECSGSEPIVGGEERQTYIDFALGWGNRLNLADHILDKWAFTESGAHYPAIPSARKAKHASL